MSSKRSYKNRNQHGKWLLNFFKNQDMKGIRWIRQKDLKDEARKHGMSPTMLHDLLKLLSWYVVRTKNPEGLQGVFYGLSSKWREQFIEDTRLLHDRVSWIHELPEAEKKKQLKSLVGITIARFTDFVPYFLDYAVRNEEGLEDRLQDWLTGCFQWVLLPYVFETIRAFWREPELRREWEEANEYYRRKAKKEENE